MIGHAIELVIFGFCFAAVMLYLLSQVRKPTGWAGRSFLWIMNKSHARVTDWGLSHVRIEEHFKILDVGCGGGRTVGKLAAIATNGKVHGVDFAAGSVAASRATNARLIQEGRVEINEASVSRLPYTGDQFDLVTAVETHYYWPRPAEDVGEILRILKPGGTLILIAENYRVETPRRPPATALKRFGTWILSAAQHRELLASAGYTAIEIFEDRGRGWLCGIGKKPLASG